MFRSSRRTSPRQSTNDAGFTLIEMLVVLGIIGLITALVGPQVIQYLGRAKTDTARAEIHNLGLAIDLFRLDVGRYPNDQEGLKALVAAPERATKWNGPYLRQKSLPSDPWGRTYVYRVPGQRGPFDLYTLGADNMPGGTGENQDIANW
jgi:general secretion pathway protein G